MVGLLIHNIFV